MKKIEIPYFIQMRGCINCRVSKKHKEKTGKKYSFDHELMSVCVIRGCTAKGYSLGRPFFDMEQLLKTIPEKIEDPKKALSLVEQHRNDTKNNYGVYYKELGVDIDEAFDNIRKKIQQQSGLKP